MRSATTVATRSLTTALRYSKIEFQNGNPYNLRWQWKFKPAYFTYPKDSFEQTHIKKPEDSAVVKPIGYTYWQDLMIRVFPTFKMYWGRRRRITDPFQMIMLPSLTLFFYQFWDQLIGCKSLTILFAGMFYIRMRDRCIDPVEFQEHFLRDMIHKNPELGALFKPESIHVIDYELDYDEGFPDDKKFPEFRYKLFKFFNTDGSFTNGFFRFGDVDSGATMLLKVHYLVALV
jgi:hypothetical protein